jgi:hypothetical protein
VLPYLFVDKNDYNTRIKIGYSNKIDYDKKKYSKKIVEELNGMNESGKLDQKRLA